MSLGAVLPRLIGMAAEAVNEDHSRTRRVAPTRNLDELRHAWQWPLRHITLAYRRLRGPSRPPRSVLADSVPSPLAVAASGLVFAAVTAGGAARRDSAGTHHRSACVRSRSLPAHATRSQSRGPCFGWSGCDLSVGGACNNMDHRAAAGPSAAAIAHRQLRALPLAWSFTRAHTA